MSKLMGIARSWKFLDEFLSKLQNGLRKFLRIMRTIQVLSILLVLLLLGLAASVVVIPQLAPYYVAGILVLSIVPWIGLAIVARIPLKLKSLKKLAKADHPKAMKELAIRVAARKLHEQSIESEELLVDTAINEGKKAVKKYRERAKQLESSDSEESS